ncbi:MAG: LysM peptidoglycan-binding domain-containing protein [Candidatus Promineifilaceae bacterium]|nr:LysM peptidoglycan-binding domain-containing protein [Candidatus Promineifilaceae bacterium]
MKKIQNHLLSHKMIWVVIVGVLAVLLLSAASSHAAPENQCGGYHYIQRGETLYSIGKQYGVSIPALMRANPHIRNADRIYADTYLYIPCGPGDGGTGGLCRQVHHVAWGETLSEIGLKYRVSPYAIAQANGIRNLDLIYAGQTLCIP